MNKMDLKSVLFRKIDFILLGIYSFLICKSTESIVFHKLVDTYTDSYDITLVCKLNENFTYLYSYDNIFSIIYEGNYVYCNNAEIHSRTNALSLPIYFDGRVLKSGKKSLEFIVDSFYPNSIYSKNHVEYDSKYYTISNSYENYHYGYRKIFVQGNSLMIKSYEHDKSFNIDWIQDETATGCISMTYFKVISRYDSSAIWLLRIYGDYELLEEYKLEDTDNEFKTLIMKFNRSFEKNKKYYLTINKYNYDDYSVFGLKRIAQCTDSGKVEDVYEINNTEKVSLTPTMYIYPSKTQIMTANTNSSIECSKNKYGADCSARCSQKKTFCKNMLFCTYSYGCSCAAGYTGPLCNQECSKGTYGRRCQKICSENCKTHCDNILGTCKGGCKNNFILPYCIEKYPVLIEPPKLEFSDFHSINLILNLTNENIFGSKSNIPSFYQIVYKPTSSELDFQYLPITDIDEEAFFLKNKISNLEAGTMYTVGVILITKDGNSNKDDINTANYFTQCFNPKKINYGMKLTPGTDNITVTWEKLRKNDVNECNITSFILKLMSNLTRNENSVFQEEILIKDNEHVFNNLIPSHTYAVQLIGQTILGTINVSDVKYATTETFELIDIEDISVLFGQNSESSLLLSWKLGELINSEISYKIKYKVNRHFSCSYNIINNDWKEIIVHNVTEYYLFGLIPNSQYIIKVEPITNGYNYSENENIIYAMTAPSTPRTSPVLDNNGTFYVSNQTATIKWLVDKKQCVKLNGFQTGFYYKLKNLAQDTIIENDTDDTSIEFNNLMPNTSYVLEVYIKTKKGYNENFMLKVPFQTKSKFLPAIENLSVYKKNSKTKTIGLRWSYDNESDINGFIIHLIASNYKVNSKQMTIEVPSRCTAWPDMYCETIDNLTPSTQYTIKIKAKSLDYPNGGLVASEDFNTVDGIPDEPGNLTITYVGTNNISLEWNIPWMFNGALNSFIINAEEVSAIDIDSCCTSYPPIELLVTEEKPTYTYTLDNLKPGSTYAIGVLSKTSWYSQAKRIHVTTLID
ncbi:uncharacterized protein LOC126900075 isoform X3 [Daktulosphaira vitifoliae]|uniref:uncharacterized protein LOC126900075 isoform X2 n=1 Tax=Daktulosphaira vitifoliae TaxID=58002 RepID=UPI0021A9D390|nr:uncharacterized protein LOC126900075 isoform X2 [Daktulosphaira vitifoliae]XP_050531491.1 uncharacterized protein LOC126900075 isoform X3 [Daktulosphaira vitifoliae]